MAGINLNLKADFAPVYEMMSRMRAVPDDMSQPFSQVGELLKNNAQENIRMSRQWDGKPMLHLALATKLARAGGKSKAYGKRGGVTKRALEIMASAKPLLDHGRLLNSYTYRATAQSVVVGSNAVQAALMHFGGMAGRNHKVHVPDRPVLGITPADNAEITRLFSEFIARQLS